MAVTCAWCKQPAKGFATIDDDRYCHDGPDPTCYQLASWWGTPDNVPGPISVAMLLDRLLEA